METQLFLGVPKFKHIMVVDAMRLFSKFFRISFTNTLVITASFILLCKYVCHKSDTSCDLVAPPTAYGMLIQ